MYCNIVYICLNACFVGKNGTRSQLIYTCRLQDVNFCVSSSRPREKKH